MHFSKEKKSIYKSLPRIFIHTKPNQQLKKLFFCSFYPKLVIPSFTQPKQERVK